MAVQERNVSGREAELWLKGAAVVEIIVGIGMALVPGLGVPAAVAMVLGIAEYVGIDALKFRQQKN